MKQTIAFRVDSGLKIGTGHVMRCLTLALALRDMGIDSVFICRPTEGGGDAILTSFGFKTLLLPTIRDYLNVSSHLLHGNFLQCSQEEDAEATMRLLKGIPEVTSILVDHYGIYKPWDLILGEFYTIYKLDDLADREHNCQGIIDQNFYVDMEHRYDDKIPVSSKRLIGPRYAILRPQFCDVNIMDRRSRRSLDNALVSFGGQDANGYAFAITEDLLTNSSIAVTVMGRPTPSQTLAWKKLADEYPNRLTPPSFISDPLKIMMKADLYIGAGGTITWERFACGLPGIVYSIAKNQIQMAKDLEFIGIQAYAGSIGDYSWNALSKHLQDLSHPEDRWALSSRIRDKVDGRGAQRIINEWFRN